MSTTDRLLRIHPEIRETLDAGGAVVALESTLITHGLPRPDNLKAALVSEAAVRSAGAVPATVALHDGKIAIGLSADDLEELSNVDGAPKVSRQHLAGALNADGWGGTTVSATMIAAHLAGIGVFATGGIGGVHIGGESSMDISADLEELANTPVAVVCAGPKSILDVGRTLEALETRGVPVVGWKTDELAGFYSRSSGYLTPQRVEDGSEAAALISNQRALGLDAGVLICVPLPEEVALSRGEVAAAVAMATEEAAEAGIHGQASTPFVLGRVAEITEGRSVVANIALIKQDAEVAGAVAVALASRTPKESISTH
jgi:pseudouridine-5'-phosphate glycosidase